MNMKKIVPLGAAVVLGLLAAEMVVKMAQGNKGAVTSKLNTAKVVVLKQDVNAGDELTTDELSIGELSAGSVPTGTYTDPAELVGRVTTVPLISGQAITDSLLAPRGSTPGVAPLIPPGMRAITVEITEFSAVAYYLCPGSKVDIIHTMRNDSVGGSLTKTIAQDVKVLTVGTHPNPADTSPQQLRSVTLLVTPKQAEAVALASANGRPVFSLRNSLDAKTADVHGITMTELMGPPKDEAPATTPVLAPTTQQAPVQDVFAPDTTPKKGNLPAPQYWSIRVITAGEPSLVRLKVDQAPNDSDIGNTDETPVNR